MVATVLLAACATPGHRLGPGAAEVVVAADRPEGCADLGRVEGEGLARRTEDAVADGLAALKANARARGATHVFLERTRRESGWWPCAGAVFSTSTRAEYAGRAFRCPSS
jgi:hypothetical protein